MRLLIVVLPPLDIISWTHPRSLHVSPRSRAGKCFEKPRFL